ncbi:MAG: hypothetical protein ACYSUK_00660 [Planctomycetota bacterium]|jgi:hypothetical protein
MVRDMEKNNQNSNRIIHLFAAEKKKSVMALCLISLMVFMWIRVLLGKGPEGTEAAVMPPISNAETSASSIEVSFIELPRIEGRHDVLARDIFSWHQWQGLRGYEKQIHHEEQIDVVSEEGKEGVIRRIANQLRLEAIELGQKPRIFLNEEFLLMGEKLHIKDGKKIYECEVISIKQEVVVIQCGQSQIRLKLSEAIEVLE